jgi:hypothetical protein
MSIQEIANRLVELCRKGELEKAQDELFSQDAVSIEPEAFPPIFEKETKGLEAIREKGERWNAIVEATHSIDVSEPLLADSSFAVAMRMDLTLKGQGRMVFSEICMYRVKEGKIISEQFG